MTYLDRLKEIYLRVQGYPVSEVVVELVILWIVVYLIQRFLKGTRGGRVFKGMALVLLVATPLVRLIAHENQFERLQYVYSQFVTFAALTLVIVFQPELRRALVRLGEARFFRGNGLSAGAMIEEIVASVEYLSRQKVGALIAIERQVALGSVVEAGTPMDAQVSRNLLNTIFWPGSALHDMAVVIREERIAEAGAQLPLAEGSFSSELGSRHRAAIGLTQETDAFVVVVSEETGIVSVVERGQLVRNLTAEGLRAALARALGQKTQRTTATE